MKSSLFKSAVAVALTAMCSCTGNIDEPAAGNDGSTDGSMLSCPMVFNGTAPSFEAGSRAEGTEWADNDVVYINFDLNDGETTYGNAVYYDGQWTVNYNGRLISDEAKTCRVFYVKNNVTPNANKSAVTINHSTEVYADTEATYIISNNVLTLAATLQPYTSRIKLANSGSALQFEARGINYITGIDFENMQITMMNTGDFNNSSLTTNAESYIYGYLDESLGLRIKRGNSVFQYELPDNVSDFMAVGASGYLNMPTDESHNGWSMMPYVSDSYSVSTYRYQPDTYSDNYKTIDFTAVKGSYLMFRATSDFYPYSNSSYLESAYFDITLTGRKAEKVNHHFTNESEPSYRAFSIMQPLQTDEYTLQIYANYWQCNQYFYVKNF